MRTVTDFNFAVIPLFLLMGAFATTSGMSRELFRSANTFVGHLRGGLGIATIAACGGFAAICGSSVATAATFSRVAYPEMRRYHYPQVVRHRRDRGRRHARHHDPALDRARGLRPDHRAGCRQAVRRRHHPRHRRRADVHGDHHHHRPREARLPAGRRARAVAGADQEPARSLGDRAAVRLRDRRHLRRHVHRDRGRRHGRRRRLPARHSARAGCRGKDILRSLLEVDAHHRRGVHHPDRRDAVRLLPDHHADAAEGDGIPDRARPRALTAS